jgi:mannonate dehydratase
MMKVAAWCFDLTDSGLRRLVQLGVECADALPIPEDDRGVFILDEAVALKKHINSYGMAVNRISLPQLSEKFMNDEAGSDEELDIVCEALTVLGKAGYPLPRVHFANTTDKWMVGHYQAEHRGGYKARGDSLALAESNEPATLEVQQAHWKKVCQTYERLVPIAEEYNLKLMMHPADPPTADCLFGGLNFHRLIDAFPNACVGYLYCCGTRSEAGGLPLVLDEVHNYGRKGRIFEIHFRNTRASFATAGSFEEVLLDDGDMNMFKILLELRKVEYDGALNADHYPLLEGDVKGGGSQSLAYSVGYMKALLAALACV